jgi:hypothetical protein
VLTQADVEPGPAGLEEQRRRNVAAFLAAISRVLPPGCGFSPADLECGAETERCRVVDTILLLRAAARGAAAAAPGCAESASASPLPPQQAQQPRQRQVRASPTQERSSSGGGAPFGSAGEPAILVNYTTTAPGAPAAASAPAGAPSARAATPPTRSATPPGASDAGPGADGFRPLARGLQNPQHKTLHTPPHAHQQQHPQQRAVSPLQPAQLQQPQPQDFSALAAAAAAVGLPGLPAPFPLAAGISLPGAAALQRCEMRSMQAVTGVTRLMQQCSSMLRERMYMGGPCGGQQLAPASPVSFDPQQVRARSQGR